MHTHKFGLNILGQPLIKSKYGKVFGGKMKRNNSIKRVGVVG